MILGINQTELPWGKSSSLDPADIPRICDEIAGLGAKSIRLSACWGLVEPNRNHKYNFDKVTPAVDAAEAAGLDILLICEPRRFSWLAFFGVPLGISATDKNATDYGLFCGALAKEYGDRIKYWEVGNEVNNLGFFGAPSDPSKYLEFLREAYTNIMPHAPNATVLAGALQAVATDPALGRTMHPVDWVKEFYDAAPQGFYHGISMHPYSTDGVFNPLTPTPDNEYAFKNISAIRAVMDANGDGPDGANRLIYCTEWGYDSVRSLNGLSTTTEDLEAEQAANIETHWNILKTYADAGMIYPTTWVYNGRDQTAEDEAQYRFGLERIDYTRKRAWTFIRSLADDSDIVLPAAMATAQAWAPEVEEFVDPSMVKAPAATATAQAWPPIVGERIDLPAATATAQAWAPTLEVASLAAEVVTVGTPGRVTPAGTSSASISMSIDVTDERGRLLLVPLVVSTSNLRDWSNYLPVVTSDIGGALSRRSSRHIGSSSVKHGSVHWYGLYHPKLGTHNIDASVADAFTGFTAFAGVPILVRGAAGYGTATAAGSSSGGNTPRITLASLLDHLTLALFGVRNNLTGINHTELHWAGSLVDGDGRYIVVAAAPGANLVTFEDTTVGLQVFGALAIDVPNLVSPQADITLPAAMATAQAWAPDVGVAGTINLPPATATAEAWPPLVGERLALPAASATAQAHPPVVGEHINLPAASATATAWPPTVGTSSTTPAVRSIVGLETAGSAQTITLGTHQAGDQLVGANFNSNFTTLPSTPTGWTVPTNGTRQANNTGTKVADKTAASSSETSGDWGTAGNALIIAAIQNCSGIGAVANTGGSGATLSTPALTLQNTSGTSKVLVFMFIANASGGNLSTPPAGHTVAIDLETGNNCDGAAYITTAGVSSYPGGDTVNHSVGAAWSCFAVELLA